MLKEIKKKRWYRYLWWSLIIFFIGIQAVTILMKNSINNTTKEIEQREGKPILQVLNEKIKEDENMIEIITRNGYKDKTEAYYGKPLKSLSEDTLRGIISNNNLK